MLRLMYRVGQSAVFLTFNETIEHFVHWHAFLTLITSMFFSMIADICRFLALWNRTWHLFCIY